MENAEKVQEASPKKMDKTPEEVQQEAESSTKEENLDLTTTVDMEEPESKPEVSVEAESGGQDTNSNALVKEIESPTEPEIIQSESDSELEEAVKSKDPSDKKSEPSKAKKKTTAKKAPKADSEEKEVKSKKSETKKKKEKPAKKEEVKKIDATLDETAENSEDHVEEIEEELDFSNATKEELLTKMRELEGEEKIPKIDRVLKLIKPRFDEIFEAEKLSALNKFELEGHDPDSFEFHGDEIDKEFNSLYSKQRSKRNRFYKDQENQREENLKKKEHLLEQLRELVDGEESSTSINAVKEIQGEWKKTGPVPGAHNKTLWANYNALLDRFYDQRSIYFELKDLDRKKNLKLKQDICERAEALATNEDLKSAIVQLNELHEEYKHAGSVPREDQEPLWQRFKAASDTVYARRKEYFDHLKEEFEENYSKKLKLAEEAESYISFDSESITEWNSKTKEIQALQKKWEAIGGLPRDKAKSINKQFWGSFKKFFNAKNQFFKRLESQRDENLQKKEELISQAEEIKESSDWGATTQKFKNLQSKWKDIGPVPEKVRNSSYKRFKAACDHFFERRRAQNSEQDKEYEENLKLKLQICDQIESIAEKDEINLDDIYDLIDNHAQLGFVPRNAIKKDRSRFEAATEKILSLDDLKEGDKADLKNHIQLSRMKNSPGGDRKLMRKGHSIKRKISELESDISTWNTNMEFFASSAAADKLKADLQEKINAAKGELENLKSQLGSISQ